MTLPKLPQKGETLVLDPSNMDHQALVRLLMQSQSAPVLIGPQVRPKDTLTTAPTPMQKVLTASDLENIRAAQEKRARKASRL